MRRVLALAAALLALSSACSRHKSSTDDDAVPGRPRAGTPCVGAGERECQDGATLVECRGGTWVAHPCRGSTGCQKDGTAIVGCDEGPSKAGDPCFMENNQACSVEKDARLKCVDGKWTALESCRGPKGCTPGVAMKLGCDVTAATPGEACWIVNRSCSLDKKTELACEDRRWVAYRTCLGARHCEAAGERVRCDATVGSEGDVCGDSGDTACSVDGKAELECSKGRYRVFRPCPHGCKVDGEHVACR